MEAGDFGGFDAHDGHSPDSHSHDAGTDAGHQHAHSDAGAMPPQDHSHSRKTHSAVPETRAVEQTGRNRSLLDRLFNRGNEDLHVVPPFDAPDSGSVKKPAASTGNAATKASGAFKKFMKDEEWVGKKGLAFAGGAAVAVAIVAGVHHALKRDTAQDTQAATGIS